MQKNIISLIRTYGTLIFLSLLMSILALGFMKILGIGSPDQYMVEA